MIRHAIFALGVVLIGSADYNPRQLVIDHTVDRIPATNPQTCNEAVKAIAHGWWTIDASRAMISIGCEPGDIFPPGEDKDQGAQMMPDLGDIIALLAFAAGLWLLLSCRKAR